MLLNEPDDNSIPGIFIDVQKYSTLGKFKNTKLKLCR